MKHSEVEPTRKRRRLQERMSVSSADDGPTPTITRAMSPSPMSVAAPSVTCALPTLDSAMAVTLFGLRDL